MTVYDLLELICDMSPNAEVYCDTIFDKGISRLRQVKARNGIVYLMDHTVQDAMVVKVGGGEFEVVREVSK